MWGRTLDFDKRLILNYFSFHYQSGSLNCLQSARLEMEQEASKLEQEATNQLHTLATRSEEALDKLNSKLEKSQEKVKEYNNFISQFATNLITLMASLRSSLYEEKSLLDQR